MHACSGSSGLDRSWERWQRLHTINTFLERRLSRRWAPLEATPPTKLIIITRRNRVMHKLN